MTRMAKWLCKSRGEGGGEEEEERKPLGFRERQREREQNELDRNERKTYHKRTVFACIFVGLASSAPYDSNVSSYNFLHVEICLCVSSKYPGDVVTVL